MYSIDSQYVVPKMSSGTSEGPTSPRVLPVQDRIANDTSGLADLKWLLVNPYGPVVMTLHIYVAWYCL